MLRKRAGIQRSRCVGRAELEPIMEPELYAAATMGQRLRLLGKALAPLFRRG